MIEIKIIKYQPVITDFNVVHVFMFTSWFFHTKCFYDTLCYVLNNLSACNQTRCFPIMVYHLNVSREQNTVLIIIIIPVMSSWYFDIFQMFDNVINLILWHSMYFTYVFDDLVCLIFWTLICLIFCLNHSNILNFGIFDVFNIFISTFDLFDPVYLN